MNRENAFRWAKVILILPAVVVWDIFYWALGVVWTTATWIDTNGASKLEQFVGNKPW